MSLAGLMGRSTQDATGESGRATTEADQDIIYYFQAIKAHLHEIKVSGPFRSVDAMIPTMASRLRDESAGPGERMLADMVADGAIRNCQHIQTPLADGNIMRLEIYKERNAAVAGRLPCETWRATSLIPMLDDARSVARHADGSVQVDRVEHIVTHLTLDDANQAALGLHDGLMTNFGESTRHEEREDDGLYSALIIPEDDSAEDAHLVTVYRAA